LVIPENSTANIIADGGKIAAACMKALMSNIPPSFCWKHADFGTIPTLCPPGMFRSLALCFDYCIEGYTHVLGVCWKGIHSYIPHSVTNFSAVCEDGKYLMGALCYRDCKTHNMVNCELVLVHQHQKDVFHRLSIW